MKSIIKNILIGLVIIGIILFAYYYFVDGKNDQGSSLSSNSGATILSVNNKISEDTAFLSTLIGLSSIRIDTSLFTSKSFSSLVDNHVSVGTVGTTGRSNPFAPIEVPVVTPTPEVLPGADGTVPANSSNTNSVLNRLLNSSTNQ
jgi:hypothetical protein